MENSFNQIKIADSKSFKESTISIVNPADIVLDKNEIFKIPVTHAKVKVKFSEKCGNSVRLPDLKFTNCIPVNVDEGSLESSVEMAFGMLHSNPQSIKSFCEPVTLSGKNKQRIERVISNYLDEDTIRDSSDLLYKSDLRAASINNSRSSFRVVSLYAVEPRKHKQQKHSKHILSVIFVDPYHLFIPSKDFGVSHYDKVKDFTGDAAKKIF